MRAHVGILFVAAMWLAIFTICTYANPYIDPVLTGKYNLDFCLKKKIMIMCNMVRKKSNILSGSFFYECLSAKKKCTQFFYLFNLFYFIMIFM
jgi:hypothetical protein